ncbi:UNVERIFIED_CONTAM: hypothetical protein PYX00_001167 [Menopon gallinae]
MEPSKISGFPSAIITLIAISLCTETSALSNNLARTPPMGWSSWERFRCNVDCVNYPDECVSETLYRTMADKMVEDGYLAAGYEYLLLDDCWLSDKRNLAGMLVADPVRFPSGMKNLSQYVHSRGLKFGIYEDYGTHTCEGYPGIRDYTMAVDSGLFAYWEVDYVKLDGCYSDPFDMDMGYSTFGKYLLATGRPMVYSCSWPFYQHNIGLTPNYTLIADTCNLWRNYADVQDSWQSVRDIMNYYGSHQDEFQPYAGPDHWNDPDMLVIGNYGLTYDQAKAQMSVWAVMTAPLIMSHDLRTVKSEFKDILLNPFVIQVNQDPMGIQGRRIYLNKRRKCEFWAKPVHPIVAGYYSWAFAAVNVDDAGQPTMCTLPLKYTKMRQPYSLYFFADLFEPDSKVTIKRNKLMVRIPPLGGTLIKAELRGRQEWPPLVRTSWK